MFDGEPLLSPNKLLLLEKHKTGSIYFLLWVEQVFKQRERIA